ncbi:amino acid adenylation domain-containing protein [Nonomuraea sp. NBC_01738]|nr:amino acid adenylation domain-containing protein [Nonomuraea sp. NBC_01738]
MHPAIPVTTLGVRLRIRGPVDQEALRRALTAIAARHEALRSTVALDADGLPYAVVHDPATVPLTAHPLGADPERVARTAAAHVFDTGGEAPLIRADLCPLDGGDAELVVVVDHLAFDGGSVAILMTELDAELSGRVVAEPAVQVGDVAIHDATALEAELARLRAFWAEELDGAPVADPAPPDLTAARVIRPLPEALTAGVAALARACGATPFAVYLAAIALASGEQDALVGMSAARRARPELLGVIGPLIDSLPVRVRPEAGLTFRDLVRQAAGAATRAWAHQEIPPADLPRAPVLLAMQHDEVPVRLGRLELLTDLGSGAAVHELSVLINRSAGGPELHVEYATSRLTAGRAEAYADRLLWLLARVLDDPGRPLAAHDLVTPAERATLLAGATGPALPRFPATIPGAIAAHTTGTAATGPDGTALSYADLHAWSDRVAHALVAHGVRPGEVVGACLPRDHLTPAVLLAVWKAGAAYLPLDPDHPADRLRALAGDAGARVILARAEARSALGAPPQDVRPAEAAPVILDADHLAATAPVAAATAALPVVVPGDLAYVLHTSGSTGRPKGVEVTHGGLAAFVAGMTEALRLTGDDVHLAVAPLTFDISATELWSTLAAGATVAVVDRATAVDGHALAEALERTGATVADLVPTAFRMLLAAGWQGDGRLRAIAGGETLDAALAGEILARTGELWNAYGPTEASVTSTMHRVTKDEPGPIPIGRPMPGERAYIVDSALRLVPPGAVGELLLGGAGVARGYRGQDTGAFVADPFEPGGRCYRTGDLVRARPDGVLEFHGRRDHQVKVRGYRIELGEIESALREVADGVVTVVGEGAEAHLVGYLAPGQAGVEAAEHHLRTRLPAHMVPRRWVTLAELPALPNGKIDRRALPEPEAERAEHKPLSTDPEHLAAAVWADVLERPEIWADDDFFTLGGHSFAATRVVGRLRETLGLAVPVRLLFERPVLADFAAGLEELLVAELMGGERA